MCYFSLLIETNIWATWNDLYTHKYIRSKFLKSNVIVDSLPEIWLMSKQAIDWWGINRCISYVLYMYEELKVSSKELNKEGYE